MGKFIATRRALKVRKWYDAIGGGSPALAWTKAQGDAMCARLDEMSPDTAPHRFYVSFRYAPPFADDALQTKKADGITRAVAFTQYPQWSCSTTGSSSTPLTSATIFWCSSARSRCHSKSSTAVMRIPRRLQPR